MAPPENEVQKRLRRAPLSWAELETIILSSNVDDLSKLARSHEQHETYCKGRDDIKNEWECIYDYLLVTKFGFDWDWANGIKTADFSASSLGDENRTQRKKQSIPTLEQYLVNQQQCESEEKHSTQYKLCLNDFPYYFVPGVQHWVLWKLGGGDVTPEEIYKAKVDIAKENRMQGATDAEVVDEIEEENEHFLHWINPPHLKSLPGIDHVHILFRGKAVP